MTTAEVSDISNIFIGLAAVVSLMVSVVALRKSSRDQELETAPSIVLEPSRFRVIESTDRESHFSGILLSRGDTVRAREEVVALSFAIDFECSNEGRGAAFNIKSPTVVSPENFIKLDSFKGIPLYLKNKDGESVLTFSVGLSFTFNKWVQKVDQKIPVRVEIAYQNDQNSVLVKSFWSATVRPFEVVADGLRVRKYLVYDRRGGVTYSLDSTN